MIDYFYVKRSSRGLKIAYDLIKKLLLNLIELGIDKAIMQLQTYNPQRFLHYALSDKNIISSTKCQQKEEFYEDQILLIKDLKIVCNMSYSEFIRKAQKYLKELC